MLKAMAEVVAARALNFALAASTASDNVISKGEATGQNYW